jgi:hypothetical protein
MNVAFCLPGKTFTGGFLQSWTQLLYTCISRGIVPMISQHYSPVIYFVRNMCLGGSNLRGSNQKIFNGEEKDIDYIMWIDSDIVFKPNDFFKLLEDAQKGYPIVSGIYPLDNDNYSAIKKWDKEYFLENGTFEFINRADISEKKFLYEANYPIIRVPYNGFGFMLIKREVFDSLEYPWFKPETITIKKPDGTEIVDFASEDASFCLNADKKGFFTWVDTEVIVGHEKSVILI